MGPFLVFFNVSSIFVGIYGTDNFLQQIYGVMVISFFTYIFWVYQIMMQQNINVELITQMSGKIEEQSMFKQILNTLEESIIIIQSEQIEIVNDTFLNKFGDFIQNYEFTTIISAYSNDMNLMLKEK